MAFSTETNRADYDGNGVATSFPLPFPWQLDEDIKVIATDKTVTPNVEHNLVLDVDYTLTGVGESSGTLTFPKAGSTYSTLATGWSITALRVPAFTQETDFQFGDGVEPEPLEAALDRNAMGLGALQEQVNRCLTLPESYSGDPLAVPLPVASSVLAWNAAGDALENGPTTTQISDAQGYAVAAQAAQGLAEDARDAALIYSGAASDSADAAGASESACAGYQAAVQAEGTTQVNRVISEGDTQVGLCEDQVDLAAEYATKAEDSPITGHPTDYSAYHWSKKAETAAQGGAFKVSADDTTPGYLEAKLAVASNGGLILATTSPAGNEVRSIAVKVKVGGGIKADADGLSVSSMASPPFAQGIINGDLAVWQRGTSFTGIAGGSAKTVFLTASGNWTVPADWNNASNSVECIGGGAGGGGGGNGCGGGGGAYAKRTNLSLSGTIAYTIGAAGAATPTGGGDTFFNAASMPAPGTTANIGAKGGSSGSGGVGGAGGLASSSNGATVYSGGAGGAPAAAGGGGGGAAGQSGAGSAGGANGGSGGNSGGISGGAGGAAGTAGGAGTDYTATAGGTAGPGGGGGGGSTGGAGGLYGAGGGGASSTGAAGAPGLIVVQYETLVGGTYTADMWFASVQGGDASVSRQAGTNGYPYKLRLQRAESDTTTSEHKVGHIIEGIDCLRFRSEAITLSFTAKKGANYSGGDLSVNLYTGTVADEGLLSLLAETWTGSVKEIDDTQAITTSDVQYSFAATLDADINEIGIVIGYTPAGTAGADDWIEIEGVALKLGTSVAEPADFPQYDGALHQCQRRCVVAAAYIPATTAQNIRALHMRAIPSITGGGSGFVSTGTSKDSLIGYQTSGGAATLTLAADL